MDNIPLTPEKKSRPNLNSSKSKRRLRSEYRSRLSYPSSSAIFSLGSNKVSAPKRRISFSLEAENPNASNGVTKNEAESETNNVGSTGKVAVAEEKEDLQDFYNYSDRFVPKLTDSGKEKVEKNFNLEESSEEEIDVMGCINSKVKVKNQQDIVNNLMFSQILNQKNDKIFCFKTPRQKYIDDCTKTLLTSARVGDTWQDAIASNPGCSARRIAKIPFKVLDAPQLEDDFYLNLVDWSSQNVIAVGLSSSVYLWSAITSKVTKLCDMESNVMVTSVSWTQRGTHLAIGTAKGEVQIWEVASGKKVQSINNHHKRIGALNWFGPLLATGGRDKVIFQVDTRSRSNYTLKLVGHSQEVCGLKWSPDGQQLASGGNDNRLLIWNLHSNFPIFKLEEHKAAVKAIAWSPHQAGLLVSGGGTADQYIRFWNTCNGTLQLSVDTGSQVCNLAWSKNVNEIVSTHGYSLNQVVIWKYPSMMKLCNLTGHTSRVLYLSMAPDGQTIVTGAGDETLRFWKVFPGFKSKENQRIGSSLMLPSGSHVR